MALLSYALFFIFGLGPSLVWLAFYLRQDDHPEPKRMLLKVFFLGMFSTLPALLLEYGFKTFFGSFTFAEETFAVLYVFIGIAFVEELMKFLVVRLKIYSNKELDEPVDLIMYMVVSALGFSALENMFVFSNMGDIFSFNSVMALSLVRLLGATFLHALSSALLGYFLALSFFFSKYRLWFFAIGLALSTLLHGFFDFTILTVDGAFSFWGPFIIFILTILFVSFAISQLKRLKSVCTI